MKSKTIAVYALMSALVAVATIAIRIPMAATDGYLNIGDGIVLFAGVAFGPLAGFVAGGIGSALADLIGGYAHWVLPTLLIKGAEGAVAGILFLLLKKAKWQRFVAATVAALPAVILMVAGYFFASYLMKGSWAVALTGLPGNAVQGGVGIVLCIALLFSTSRIKNFSALVGKNQFYEVEQDPSKKEE